MKEKFENLVNRDIGPKLYVRNEKKFQNERLALSEKIKFNLMYCYPFDKFDNTGLVRDLLLTESIHSGHQNTSAESKKYIPEFIKFHEIDMSQFKRENPDDYKSFDDFFTREVKPDKRPISEPNDNSVVVSAADCRLSVFESQTETKELFIKGKAFTFHKLLGGDTALYEIFKNGSVANFRLSPQDYHRYHTPVGGKIENIILSGRTTYSVEPVALKSDIDVLGENERHILVIDGDGGIGKVAFIAIGAERVGKVTTLVQIGQHVNKGEEVGYFSYGGSDIVVMFEKKVNWDQDIREQTLNGTETYLWVNEKIGKIDLSS